MVAAWIEQATSRSAKADMSRRLVGTRSTASLKSAQWDAVERVPTGSFGKAPLPASDGRFTQRWMRAEPPLASALTCSTVAIVVSPGNVVSKAPCAQPSLTASSGSTPVSRP